MKGKLFVKRRVFPIFGFVSNLLNILIRALPGITILLDLLNIFTFNGRSWRVFINRTYILAISFGSLYFTYNATVYFGMVLDFQIYAGNNYLNR